MSPFPRATSPSFYEPREPSTRVPRTPGGRRPHRAGQPRVCESRVCTSKSSEKSRCTPTFCLTPPADDRPPQDPSSRGATQVALGSGRRGQHCAVAGQGRWWRQRVRPPRQPVCGLLPHPGRKGAPRVLWGSPSAPGPSPLESPRSPHPAFRAGARPGRLSARPRRPWHSRSVLLLFFLCGRSAKGLRKLPAPGLRGPGAGARAHPGQARPWPSRSGRPAPALPTPTPRSSRPRGRRPREAAGGGRSDTPERAVPPPEVPNFTPHRGREFVASAR